MGLEICHLGVLVQGIRFEIEPGTVGVGDRQPESVSDGPLSNGHHDECLSTVVVVELLTGTVLPSHLEFGVTVLLEDRDGIVHDLAFGLVAEECLVSLAEFGCLLKEFRACLSNVLGLHQKFLCELLTLAFVFCHVIIIDFVV